MELALVTVLAVAILPFGIGWWIGNPVFAAAVFGAMALTVALGAVSRGDAEADGGAALGLALSLALSAGSAAAGGYVRARRRARRAPRR